MCEYPEADAYKQPTRWRVVEKTKVGSDKNGDIYECKLICGHSRLRHTPHHRFKFMECPFCIQDGTM